MATPRPLAPSESSAHGACPPTRGEPSGSSPRLLLLEPRGSAYGARIEAAAIEAGLSVNFAESIQEVPPTAAVVGVGPSTEDPLQIARQLRASSQALLLFFTASSSARHSLNAELVRDPFAYPRFEIIQLPDNPRQLASRMGRVVSQVTLQVHPTAQSRSRRMRLRPPTSFVRPVGTDEHLLAHVLNNTREAVISTDTSGRILTWNAAAEDIFGFRAATVAGRLVDVLDARDLPGGRTHRLSAVVQDVATSGERQDLDLTCATATATDLALTMSVAPLRDGEGTPVGVVLMTRDSEYPLVQEALQEANRQKDEFLAIMSHELRTPLTSILGYTDMLLRGLSGPLAPLTTRYVGNVRSAGDRLLELVNGLLDYTRLEAGVERLELRPVDLARLVGQAVQQYQGMARNKQIDLHVALGSGEASRVEADEERLMHVLHSMLANAVKFTPAGGWVRVGVDRDPDIHEAVRVSVTDSGIGMRHDQVTHVWERFYQGDPSLTRAHGGMGLGLSIARHLVALHGGTVGAESGGPGLGSTFWFTLPRHNVAETTG